MALNATAREANLRDSIKKFFLDSIETGENVPITFDKGLVSPDLSDRNVKKWVSINFGSMQFETLSTAMLMVHCCTRQDNEGFALAQLKDKVLGYLSDEASTDGFKRITFYQSHHSVAWVEIGKLLVVEVTEGPQLDADDETKYKTLDVLIRFPSKI
jgi:hypothetical protein